tara:strand:- start:5807 stop:6328 length:522 start_codon:yes stop_codon:yes gene_type:complete
MKQSEKRLLYFLLSLALLGAAVVCSDIYFDRRDELSGEKGNLETEWIEIEALFEEKEMWELRANWLDKNQPSFTNNETITQSIFDRVQSPSISGVTTSRLTLLPVDSSPYYIQAGVSLTAEGELGRIFRWLYDLTPPTAFRVARNIKLTPSPEDPEIINAKFELLRWYAPPAR